MGKKRITLKDAVKVGDLEAFIAQAEAEGMPPADAMVFAAAIMEASKPQQSKRRTSRSQGSQRSRGKRTR
jgi:hypothetical protein